MNRTLIAAAAAAMMALGATPSFACEGLASLSQDSGSAQMPAYATHGIRWANQGPSPLPSDGSQGLVQSENSLPSGWETSERQIQPQSAADLEQVKAMQSCMFQEGTMQQAQR